MKKIRPINPKVLKMLHGADYNPDQWQSNPDILDEDIRLMKLAGCNYMSIGIFAWTALEPEEDKFDFTFLDETFRRFEDNGIYAVLATPSGARPAWMSQNHPEVLRTDASRVKQLHGHRHNHCYTSPYYRRKVSQINHILANRYKNSPILTAWHISNEYGGECHCGLCQEAFRDFLKKRYQGDLNLLNHSYWSGFWSHTYSSWDQLESPSPIGETSVHGLVLDWKRFVTYQTIDFMKTEILPLREITPDVPVTTNFMGTYPGLDYFKFKDVIDFASWDSYPDWHKGEDYKVGAHTAFHHDINRSILDGKPFMLMESTPSLANWKEYNKLKKPGMNILSSLQAVAHGSDTVGYFQWRKSRGSSEKLHGAVVDHCGHENNRVFKEVAKLGDILQNLDEVVGMPAISKVAVVYDWENRWAIDELEGLNKSNKKYLETCIAHYEVFWKSGINVDVIDSDCDFAKYDLVVAPMLYMIKDGVEEKISSYVEGGGNIVCTYVTGYVDKNDLCFLGGFPGGKLKDVFGIWAEEIDTLYPEDYNHVETPDGKTYKAVDYCELIHANTAYCLAKYKKDFYADRAAVTANNYGSGKAYFIAFRDTGDFIDSFYEKLIDELSIPRNLGSKPPHGVTSHSRTNGVDEVIFIENYNNDVVNVPLSGEYIDMVTKETVSGSINLLAYDVAILKRK